MLFVLLGVAIAAWSATASAAPRTGAQPATPTSTSTPASIPTPAPAEAEAEADKLSPAHAVVLGVVEGITEFLPISSTGHLLVTTQLLGITGDDTSESTKEAADAYAIVIQAGAILAVVVLYRRRLVSIANGLVGRDEDGRRVLIALAVAFLPAAILGLALEKTIKANLFGPWPVVAAWAVGGVVLLALSSSGWWERERTGTDLVRLSVRPALIIGFAQCLALWPGTSRSLVTIVGALLVGLSLGAAVEFSFLLGLLTLGAATALDLVKHGDKITENFGVVSPVIGFVAAFVAAVIAVRWMVSYLQRHSLAVFGWYRLAVAGATACLLLTGVL